jgi:hypothetical protein
MPTCNLYLFSQRLPLWFSDQGLWLRIQRSWVPFPVLQDFLRSSGSGMGSLSLMRITAELLEKSSGSGIED